MSTSFGSLLFSAVMVDETQTRSTPALSMEGEHLAGHAMHWDSLVSIMSNQVQLAEANEMSYAKMILVLGSTVGGHD
jgi:hypothetical protein